MYVVCEWQDDEAEELGANVDDECEVFERCNEGISDEKDSLRGTISSRDRS